MQSQSRKKAGPTPKLQGTARKAECQTQRQGVNALPRNLGTVFDDAGDGVEVCALIKPSEQPGEPLATCLDIDLTNLRIKCTTKHGQRNMPHAYTVDRIVEAATPDAVHQAISKRGVDSVLKEKSVKSYTVVLEGYSGAGKTFNSKHIFQGIVKYLKECLTAMLEAGEIGDYEVYFSYLENPDLKTVIDLLADPPKAVPMGLPAEQRISLHTRRCANMEELCGHFQRGCRNRKSLETKQNGGPSSSRSHVFATITIKQTRPHGDPISDVTLTIVDLAGSEKPGYQDSKTQEAQGTFINSSLFALRRAIDKLRPGADRDGSDTNKSALCKLLESSLKGNGKLVWCAVVSQELDLAHDTKNTLDRAMEVKGIRTQALANTDQAPPPALVALTTQLDAGNDQLRLELRKVQAALDEATERLGTSTSELQNRDKRIVELEEQLQQQEAAAFAKHAEDVSAVKSQLAQAQQATDELKAGLAEQQSKSAALAQASEQALQAADGRASELHGLLIKRDDEVLAAVAEAAKLTTQVQDLQERVANADAELVQERQTTQQLHARLALEEEGHNETKQKLDTKIQSLAQAQASVKVAGNLQKKVDDAKIKQQAVEARIGELQEEVLRLNKLAETSQQQAAEQASKTLAAETRVSNLEAELLQLRKRADEQQDTSRKLKDLQEELDQSQAECDVLAKQVQEANEQLESQAGNGNAQEGAAAQLQRDLETERAAHVKAVTELQRKLLEMEQAATANAQQQPAAAQSATVPLPLSTAQAGQVVAGGDWAQGPLSESMDEEDGQVEPASPPHAVAGAPAHAVQPAANMPPPRLLHQPEAPLAAGGSGQLGAFPMAGPSGTHPSLGAQQPVGRAAGGIGDMGTRSECVFGKVLVPHTNGEWTNVHCTRPGCNWFCYKRGPIATSQDLINPAHGGAAAQGSKLAYHLITEHTDDVEERNEAQAACDAMGSNKKPFGLPVPPSLLQQLQDQQPANVEQLVLLECLVKKEQQLAEQLAEQRKAPIRERQKELKTAIKNQESVERRQREEADEEKRQQAKMVRQSQSSLQESQRDEDEESETDETDEGAHDDCFEPSPRPRQQVPDEGSPVDQGRKRSWASTEDQQEIRSTSAKRGPAASALHRRQSGCGTRAPAAQTPATSSQAGGFSQRTEPRGTAGSSAAQGLWRDSQWVPTKPITQQQVKDSINRKAMNLISQPQVPAGRAPATGGRPPRPPEARRNSLPGRRASLAAGNSGSLLFTQGIAGGEGVAGLGGAPGGSHVGRQPSLAIPQGDSGTTPLKLPRQPAVSQGSGGAGPSRAPATQPDVNNSRDKLDALCSVLCCKWKMVGQLEELEELVKAVHEQDLATVMNGVQQIDPTEDKATHDATTNKLMMKAMIKILRAHS